LPPCTGTSTSSNSLMPEELRGLQQALLQPFDLPRRRPF
jgi:hypothetical protein